MMPDDTRLPVPELDGVDVIFGNIKHLPKWEDIPEDFRRDRGAAKPYCDFISQWFFRGLKAKDLARLTPRDGVDRGKALAAIKAVIGSFEPKHEHKEAGAGYLLSEWFELAPSKDNGNA